ncbi:MAG: hypothetical protein WC878_00405 [Candidatus Paceibacterota bacterium]|jgi:hypothetical protein
MIFFKTKKNAKKEGDESESHGISFLKQNEDANDADATNKNCHTLQAEFSSADGGIEIMESEKNTDDFTEVSVQNKKDEVKDTMEQVSKNCIVILPESGAGSDVPPDEDMPESFNKRK